MSHKEDTLVEVLAVDRTLDELAEFDPRQAKVMELHFFAGLTFEEIAAELQLSVRTIKRASDMANAWLRSQLRS